MIYLLLERVKKEYLEIVVDAGGCNLIINGLALLERDKSLRIDLSNQILPEAKTGYSKVGIMTIVANSNFHFANTDYNIKCNLSKQNEVKITLTQDGIQELQNIMEFVRDNDDHFHLYGGFNLYTEEDQSINNIISAITIYNKSNY